MKLINLSITVVSDDPALLARLEDLDDPFLDDLEDEIVAGLEAVGDHLLEQYVAQYPDIAYQINDTGPTMRLSRHADVENI